jgi:photosystem II stability/assembly factor-like uncharacterized protein
MLPLLRSSLRLSLALVAVMAIAPLQAQDASLPSGLATVSHVETGGTNLVIDSNGTLFRSDDQGRHWHSIKQQWQGKAVELLGMPGLNNQQQVAAILLKSTSALHWVSVDRGKTWKPSTLDDVRRNDVHWSGQ